MKVATDPMANDSFDTHSLRSGDMMAFDRLYAAFAPRVMGYLLRLTGGSRTEAEDLTQETFLAAYTGRERHRGASPLSWLLGIARRRQRDAARAESVRPEAISTETHDLAASENALDESVVRRTALIAALDRLQEDEREAILLVVVQGLTYTEAACLLHEPVGTVKWRVHAATGRLRKLLSGAFSEEAATPDHRKEANRYAKPRTAR